MAWLFALPLWIGDGLSSPWFQVISIAIMFTPGIAALVVVLLVDRPPQKLAALGMWPLSPIRRFLVYMALALVVPIVLVLAALPVGVLLGVYSVDLENFSGFQQTLEATGAEEIPIPLGMLVLLQLVSIPVGAVINTIPALGEELGWRGWLLPKLLSLGIVPALLISGLIWGVWHAPLVLLGYNYAATPGWLAMVTMIGMCVIIGSIFAWLRLRSGSVWPAALAHGSLNAAAGSYLLFAAAGTHIDTTHATILGWTGWIIPAALIVVLLAAGQFRSRVTECAASSSSGQTQSD